MPSGRRVAPRMRRTKRVGSRKRKGKKGRDNERKREKRPQCVMFGGEEREHLEVAPTREPVISIRFLSDGSILAPSPVSQSVSVLPGQAERPGGWRAGPTARVQASERASNRVSRIHFPGRDVEVSPSGLRRQRRPADTALLPCQLPTLCPLFAFITKLMDIDRN